MEIEPERGDIYDRNLQKLAIDCKVSSLYASPNQISTESKPAMATALSDILGMDREIIFDRLSRDKSFVWIAREVEKEIAAEITGLGLEGLKLMKENKRFYPKGRLASHIIGFTGIDDRGLEGIELEYDDFLKGKPGYRQTIRDAKRRDILSGDISFVPPSNGLDIVLSIDEAIQYIAQTYLDNACKKRKAKSGTVIVMDPYTGDILALANHPSYDLNAVSTTNADVRRNRAFTDIYEPGSVFKIVTASCALENDVAAMDQEFFCEDGEYYIGGRILHDHKPHGTLTFTEVFEKSSNIGVTKIAEIIGKDELYRFIKLFGFGEASGIKATGEVQGIIRRPDEWSGVSISAVPMGQEVAVTSIQLIMAMSAIANGGELLEPHIVSRIVSEDNNVIKSSSRAVKRRILSKATAKKMKSILKGVVERGTGRNARLDLYTSAGKTGTAQKVGPDGKYSHSKFVASFIGFAPVNRTRIAVLVSLDEPQGTYYGGTVAAPVFKEVAGDVLKYLKVKPDKGRDSIKL